MRIPCNVFKILLVAFVLGLFVPKAGFCLEDEVANTKIIVLPFQINAESGMQYLRDSLPQLLADQLKDKGFSVVPNKEMEQLIKDKNVGFLDLRMARDLALLSKAGYALYGSLSQVGDTLSLDARLVDAFGLRPDKPLFVVKKGLINILPAAEELATGVQLEIMRKDKIARIDVQGNKVLDKEVVLYRIQTQKGDVYDPKLINEDLRTIYELGYFDDVQIKLTDSPEGKVLTFIVKEKPRIQAVVIKGNDDMDTDDILEVINSKQGGILNQKVLAEDLDKVRELYRKDGYYLAKVDHKIVETGKGQARLELTVKEGEKLYITDISIEGAKQLDPDDLKSELALAERGMFSWITGSGVLKEELLERDAAALEAYYANRGFIDAKVGQPEVEFKEDGIHIIFKVQEGDRYKVGKITFTGDLLEPENVLKEQIGLDEIQEDDGYFDRSVLRSDLNRLQQFYMDYGYAFAEADVAMNPHKDTKTVDIEFRLKKQRKVFVRRVMIEGNVHTADNVIRREILIGDGDRYSGSQLSRSMVRLNKLDFFKAVDIEPVPTGDPSQLDLKVKVTEKPTGNISGGVGYSSLDSFYVGGTVEEQNLFGRGYFLGISGQVGGRQSQFKISFTNPHVYDSKMLMGGDIYWVTRDWDSYDREAIGAKARFGYPLGEYTDLYWGYRLERYKISDVESDAAKVIRDFEGTNLASILNVDVVRDTTNDNFLPTVGTVNKISAEYGGGPIGGSEDFIRLKYTTSWFKKLMWGTVFHIKGAVGYAMKNESGSDIPPWERFYLGGIDTVRGYSGDKISPKDPESGDRIGGSKEFYANVEYLFPVYTEMNIIGLVFFDAGNAWDDDESFFDDVQRSSEENTKTFGLYKSIGLGMRWKSPFGPLRFEYGYPLDDLKGSASHGRFEFSVGATF
ncbi:MAG: outer membrane protein assembly factor BamA [Desulfovibrio sp.]|uniref:outer membrane protein assembly factor BamA n=1 Tax=Desulfovibrio sp. 7SRBS1 TaxID=3378064 RepID=UPI003B3E558B